MSTKDMKALMKRVKRTRGWAVTLTRGSHYEIITPAGKQLFCPSTPGDRRGIPNTQALLRRHGWSPT